MNAGRRKRSKGHEPATSREAPPIDPAEFKGAKQYLDSFELNAIPIASLPEGLVEAVLSAHSKKPLFDGGAIDGDPPLLAFGLRDFDAAARSPTRFWPWVWQGFFGTSLTVSYMNREAEPASQARVFLPQGSETAARILRTGRFRALCVRRGVPEIAFEVSVPLNHEFPHSLGAQASSFQARPTALDIGAHYWETLEGTWRSHFGPPDLLSVSWMRAYRTLLHILQDKLNWRATEAPPDQRDMDGVGDVLHPVFGLAEEFSSLVHRSQAVFKTIFASQTTLDEFWSAVSALVVDGPANRAWIPIEILSAYLWSSEITEQGHKLPWLSLPPKTINTVSLDSRALHSKEAAADYWERILAFHGALALDWGRLIHGSDAPISPQALTNGISKTTRSGTIAKVEKRTSQVLRDAANAATTNVVERAVLRLRCGPFSSAEVVQSVSDVLVVWRTPDQEFAVFAVGPDLGTWSTLDLASLVPQLSQTKVEQFQAEARLAIAQTIRELRTLGESQLLRPEAWSGSDIPTELERFGPPSSRRGTFHAAHWILEGIRPSDAYIYLKARFGSANGLMSALRRPVSDNLFHWQFNVAAGPDLLTIKASSTRVECNTSTAQPLSLADQQLIIKRMKADFANHGAAMSTVRSELESWTLFVNPFAQLIEAVEAAERELLALAVSEPPPPSASIFVDQREAEEIGAVRRKWLANSTGAFRLAMTIRVLAPILAESFVNLVLLVLGRPEIKNDKRLYDDLLRRQIDIRVRELHWNCRHFVRAVDTEHTSFKAFQSLMNARNDLLHGNIDPTKLEVDAVLFDGNVPLFHSQRSLEATLACHLYRDEDVVRATSAIETVRAFVDHVLSHVEPAARDEVRSMLRVNPLGFRKATDRFGVLFGDMVEPVLIVPENGTAKKKTEAPRG